jgi:hypothetical protein
MPVCRCKQSRHGFFRLLLDLPQVAFTAETLGITLVDILRAGRPRGKPSADILLMTMTAGELTSW